MYSTHKEGKSVVTKRFIGILKTNIYKHMTAVSKNVDKLDEIVNTFNNTYHITRKMKPADDQRSKFIDYGVEYNDKDPKFKIADHVRI